MNKNRILILSFLTLAFVSKTNGIPSIVHDQISGPAFNNQGDLIYLYKNDEENICLKTVKTQTDETSIKTLPLGMKAFFPLIKKDRKGQIWLIWEEWEQNQSKVFIGELKEDKIASSQKVSQQEGFNFCPDLCFDLDNYPWVIWINSINSEYRVFVQEIISGRTWLLNSSFLSSAFTPKIIFDYSNLVWVFWSGRDKGEEEIFYRVFDQNNWSPLGKIHLENKFPNINPDVTLDHNGFIWLVWSGYDGQDYEICCSFWNGKSWSGKIKITDNDKENDAFPSISMVSGVVPIVAWTQSSERGSQIYVKFLENNAWSENIKISPLHGNHTMPRMVVEGEKVGIIWQSQNGIKTKFFYFDQLREKKFFHSPLPPSQIIYNPSLNENKYIGFGNSITYGYINHEPAPDKGYIPRLNSILNQNFGATEVINEGWPGEVTQNGLSRIESVMSHHLARYLLIMEGTNDVVFREISMETSAFNLREMVKKCLEFGAFPAIATILPRRDWVWYTQFYRDRIFYLNQKIHQIAIDLLIPFVDQFDSFDNYPEKDGGCQSLLSEDAKHPNEKGYQLMTEKWFDEIKNFPFPPIQITIKSRDWVWDSKFDRIKDRFSFSRFDPFDSFKNHPTEKGYGLALGLGNFIIWQHNPKIFDKSNIKGYKIYRRKAEQGNGEFQFIALIVDQLTYFDRKIIPSEKYIYVISTLRTDGVEGPCSEPTKLNEWR